MYEPFLFIHSWTRWAVLLGAGLILWRTANGWLRQAKWTGHDTHLIWAFNQVFGYQLLFGAALYFGLSPMTKASFINWSEAMTNPVLRFWSVYHICLMVLAFVVFQVGKHIAYKKTPIQRRHRSVFLTMISSMAIVCCGIPWPFFVYGRSWIRGLW